MSNDGKKVAFSFSKVKKTALVKKVDTGSKEKIDYVDCFDGSKGKFSYKGNIRSDEVVKHELVIPMPSNKSSIEVLKSRIEEKASKNLEENGVNKAGEKNPQDDKSIVDNKSSTEDCSKNLEELAALEILKDIGNPQESKKSVNNLVIETKDMPVASENDIDYDNVPVTEFGLALLRGMGWRPDQGIGKDPKIVEATCPNLRPKGLGLGAKLNTEIKEEEKSSKKSKDKRNSNSRSSSSKHSSGK